MLKPSKLELRLWAECYVGDLYDDPHQAFADLLGVPRPVAKVRCYEIIYQSKFLQDFKANN